MSSVAESVVNLTIHLDKLNWKQIIQMERQVIVKEIIREKDDVWYCASKMQDLVSKS